MKMNTNDGMGIAQLTKIPSYGPKGLMSKGFKKENNT
jgi:hypothetical protein